MPAGKLLRRIAFVFYLMAAVGLLLELFLRLADPIDIRHHFELRDCLEHMRLDPRFEYTHQPGFHREYRTFSLHINSEGFRGEEFSVAKPAGKRRLLFLGDSFVLGWGVPADSIFPSLIQEKFRQEAPEWEVIPLGVISWNTRNEVEFFRARGLDYQPDALLLFIWANDAIPKLNSYTAVEKQGLFPDMETIRRPPFLKRLFYPAAKQVVYRSYALTTLLYLLRRGEQAAEQTGTFTTGSPAWRDVKLALQELKSLCERRDIRLGAVVGLYQNSDVLTAKIYRRAYTAELDSLDIPYLETTVAWNNPDLRNSPTDGHPNGRGHREIARRLFPFIKKTLLQQP